MSEGSFVIENLTKRGLRLPTFLLKMAQEKIQMPSGMGGLMRYSEEYKSNIMFKPGTVLFLIVLVMIVEFLLHRYGGSYFGL